MPIIRVNLLPPEKRRRERTSLSRFVALIVGTAVNAAIVAFMVKTFIDTNGLIQKKADTEVAIKTTIAKVEPPNDKKNGYEAVKKNVEKVGARKKAIDDLKKEKILVWAEVIDNVCDVLAANQWVWLTGVDMGEATKGKSGAQQLDLYFTLNCSSTASEEDVVKGRIGEVMTKFKLDLHEKFKVGPSYAGPDWAKERKFPFDWADEQFPYVRKDDTNYRETASLVYPATVGRKASVAKPGVPVKK